MNYDVKSIGNEVRMRITRDRMQPKEAGAAVAHEIVSRASADALEGFLAWACTKAEREADPIAVFGRGGDHQTIDTHGQGEPNPTEHVAPTLGADGNHEKGGTLGVPEPVRAKYDALWRDPLAIVLPIGSTGERKTLGEWLKADLLHYASWCGAHMETWDHKRKNAKRLAAKMQDGETIRQAWDRLGEDDRALLPA